jgi:LysM repeat protein
VVSTATATPVITAEGLPATATLPLEGEVAAPTSTITPTATTTPTPTATPLIVIGVKIPKDATLGQCYWVGPKDTIHTIAKKFKTTPYTLNVVNDLYPENYVYINQVLFIPNRPGNGPNVRFIRPGDTLKKIAEECKTSVEELVFVNDITANTTEIEKVDLEGFADRDGIIVPIPPFPNPSRFRYPLESVQSPIVEPDCCGE